MVENPTDFGGREVRVNAKPRLFTHHNFEALLLQFEAERRRSAVLPHDGGRNGFTRFAVPDNRGFALIGHAHRGNFTRRHASFAKGRTGAGDLRTPNSHGIVFDPPGLRVELGELHLFHGHDLSEVVEDDGAGTRRSLIKREDVLHRQETGKCLGVSPDSVRQRNLTFRVYRICDGLPRRKNDARPRHLSKK